MSLAELQARRLELAAQIRDLAARHQALTAAGQAWPAEDQGQWQRLNAEYDQILQQIETAQRADGVRARLAELDAHDAADPSAGEASRGQPGRQDGEGGWLRRRSRAAEPAADPHRDQALALRAWARRTLGAPDRGEREAAERCGLRLDGALTYLRLLDSDEGYDLRDACRGAFRGAGGGNGAALQRRALSAVLGASGGFTVPRGFASALEIALLAYDGVSRVCTVATTDTGAPELWPTANDTGNEGELIGENVAAAEQDLAFAGVDFSAYLFSSKVVRVPYSLLEDSAINLAAELGRMLGERLGRVTERLFTLGTGAGQPKGVVTASAEGKVTASSTAITAGELIDLQHTLDPAYAAGATWMFHNAIAGKIRQLTESGYGHLWQPGIQAGMPDMLLGHPLSINQHMDSALTASKKVVLFGDFSRYRIRRVNTVRLRQLTERYAEYDQIGFLAHLRADGNLIDAGTNPIKHLKMKPA